MLVPLSYNLRSIFVRRSSTLLTIIGIGATVATVAGVLALQNGFATLYSQAGRSDVGMFLRPGATYEGDSLFSRDRALQLIKGLNEAELDANNQPLAGMECYLAVRRFKVSGGETNVSIRGVQPATIKIRGDEISCSDGRMFEVGNDEVVVGRKLVNRIRDCGVGDVITLNTTPFRVVGVLESEGPASSEIWGDLDRILAALERSGPNSVIAQIRPDVDFDALVARLEGDQQVPAKAIVEREYLTSQTEALSAVLVGLSQVLGLIMGIAAVFTATNTMLSAIGARVHEIGILLSTGFRPSAIFLSFLFESLLLGLLGGLVGCVMAMPLNGIETGTTNFQTFTEVAFAFKLTPQVLVTAVLFSLGLGLVGGLVPAWKAARMTPTEALRRR